MGGMRRAKNVSGAVTLGFMREFLFGLRALAINGLKEMYRPEERLFAFRVRRRGHSIVAEGLSHRYTAIVLIGLASELPETVASVLSSQGIGAVCEKLAKESAQSSNLGDVALTLWAMHALGYGDRVGTMKRFLNLFPLERQYPTVEISWALAALCIGRELADEKILHGLANRLIDTFNPKSGLFPHLVKTKHVNFRAHVSCFADMVYPIHALSLYHKLSGNRLALEVAASCADRICGMQGPDGQWWWHYDYRTGKVVEGYPVYAVHQDAMAPMALLALKESGGPDFLRHLQKGLGWLRYSPEIGSSLIDEDASVIWRKVARREPAKVSRYVQAAMSRLHSALRVPALDSLFPPVAIDFEDRPYHLGWLLYAWPAARLAKLDGSEVVS